MYRDSESVGESSAGDAERTVPSSGAALFLHATNPVFLDCFAISRITSAV